MKRRLTELTFPGSKGAAFGAALLAAMICMVSLASLPGAAHAAEDDGEGSALSSEQARAVDAVFGDWARNDAPGGVVAVVYDGKVYKQGYGIANLESGAPMTPDTRVHVASVSKQFTAYMAALLISEGRLSLDTQLQDILPAFSHFEEPITVDHLVHHTSGLRDQWSLASMAGIHNGEIISQSDILALASAQQELNFPPGDNLLYSNTGYSLLAEMEAQVTDTPFVELVDERIFTPLGMSRSTVFSILDAPLKDRAISYFPRGDGFRYRPLNFDNYGATSLQTTANDMVVWLKNLLADRPLGGKRVKQLIMRPAELNDGRELGYAFGLQFADYRGRKLIEHTGRDAGYRAHLLIAPEEKLGVVVLSNRSDADPVMRTRKVVDALIFGGSQEEEAAPDETGAENLGEFQLADGPLVTLLGTDDGVILSTPFWSAMSMTRTGPDSFAGGPDSGASLVITERRGDLIERFTAYRGPHSYPGVRVHETAAPDAAQYLGKYENDGLDTSYWIERVDGGLQIRHWRMGEAALQPVGEDAFASRGGPFGRIEFVRNDAGAVTAFRASSSRAKNVPFIRQEDE